MKGLTRLDLTYPVRAKSWLLPFFSTICWAITSISTSICFLLHPIPLHPIPSTFSRAHLLCLLVSSSLLPFRCSDLNPLLRNFGIESQIPFLPILSYPTYYILPIGSYTIPSIPPMRFLDQRKGLTITSSEQCLNASAPFKHRVSPPQHLIQAPQ
jgi:hypothetical protein